MFALFAQTLCNLNTLRDLFKHGPGYLPLSYSVCWMPVKDLCIISMHLSLYSWLFSPFWVFFPPFHPFISVPYRGFLSAIGKMWLAKTRDANCVVVSTNSGPEPKATLHTAPVLQLFPHHLKEVTVAFYRLSFSPCQFDLKPFSTKMKDVFINIFLA